jgi:tetratricopeptide (TPR) repeat protein
VTMSSNGFRCRRTAIPFCFVLLFFASVAPCPAEPEEDARARALELYDDGRYAEALPLLQRLDEAGEADGALLYRLYFCQRRTGNAAAANATLGRSIERLETDVEGTPDLETFFYLANAYRNVARLSDASRVAEEVTTRIETGELPLPQNGPDMFRVGKLYSDQERVAEATRWFERAVDRLTAEESVSSKPYIDWAVDYLLRHNEGAGDDAAVARYLTLLTSDGGGSPADLDRLAVLRCRTGEYGEAKRAWQEFERRNPAEADRARYGWRLAAAAEELKGLPATAPDGRAWSELSKEELETLLRDQATVVREAFTEAREARKLKKRLRKRLQARIDEARPIFVGAGLEFVLRGYGIRETAFFGGFAGLIFRPRDWVLPEEL